MADTINTTKLDIEGIQLDLDLMDADALEKYENLTNEVQRRVNDPAEYAGCDTNGAKMRKQCRIVDDFFDRLFGEGTANMLFHGSNHLGKRLDAFAKVSQHANHATDGVRSMIESYSPQRLANREQRRAAQFSQVGGGKKKNKTEWQ